MEFWQGFLGALIGAVALVMGQFFGPVFLDHMQRKRDRSEEVRQSRAEAVRAMRAAATGMWMSLSMLQEPDQTEQCQIHVRDLLNAAASVRLERGVDTDLAFEESFAKQVLNPLAAFTRDELYWTSLSRALTHLEVIIDEPEKSEEALALVVKSVKAATLRRSKPGTGQDEATTDE